MAVAANYKILGNASDLSQWPMVNYMQNRGAARKGKRIQRARENRERATKRKLMEAQKPKKATKHKVKIDKSQFRFLDVKRQEKLLPDLPEDNVFFVDKFKRKKFSFDEAIEFHKQVVHPDVLNVPDALVTATIELNLKMKIKKKKYIEKIDSTVCYPHVFKYQVRPRKIVALCKDPEEQERARQAGAIVVGSNDVVDLLKKSQLTQRDFDHIVCKTDFLVDFAAVKGMKGASYFPSKARGNFGDDISELVRYFRDGIDYSLVKTDDEPESGMIECHFGKLDMSHEQLRVNLLALFESVNRFKPMNLADNKQFFERVAISTPATEEIFFIRFWEIYDDYEDPEALARQAEEEAASAKA